MLRAPLACRPQATSADQRAELLRERFGSAPQEARATLDARDKEASEAFKALLRESFLRPGSVRWGDRALEALHPDPRWQAVTPASRRERLFK